MKTLLVAIGPATNNNTPGQVPNEFHPANMLEYKPVGKFNRIYASGIRITVHLPVNLTPNEVRPPIK